MSYPVDRRDFLRVSGAAAATAALGLTSCSSDTSGPVTLSWWDYFTLDNFQPGMNRLIKDIEAGVPDVSIERRPFPFAELERPSPWARSPATCPTSPSSTTSP
ncbi:MULTISPECIES: twin-arginine translocation signal domain-containing protein [Streptomyces]|uniref:twin-arginine translocation signal domain-containing protein n=1 Tax=Streptomyces TaxID=1883 RepID=UPI0009EAE845|nr:MULTISPECIES: twin-arginine translocation signal domain-containing protein [Streptomyces]